MSDEEKEHMQAIEEIMSRKMKPLYWIHGSLAVAILAVFLTVSGPLASRVYYLGVDQRDIIAKQNAIQEKLIGKIEAYGAFITKFQYHQL